MRHASFKILLISSSILLSSGQATPASAAQFTALGALNVSTSPTEFAARDASGARAESAGPSALAVTAPFVVPDAIAEGDVIFQQSQSAQSVALREATESPWTHVGILVQTAGKWQVAEASQRVMLTPLETFIHRGLGSRYIVKRVDPRALVLDSHALAELKQALQAFAGFPYDVFFEWTDQKIYCSELVWKVYHSAFGIALGELQHFSDLHLEGPAVQKLIHERYTAAGKEFHPEETIITPVGMLDSPLLLPVVSQL